MTKLLLVLAAVMVLMPLLNEYVPRLVRRYWLRQTHWNADRSACWSTASVKELDRFKDAMLANIEHDDRFSVCDPRRTTMSRTIYR